MPATQGNDAATANNIVPLAGPTVSFTSFATDTAAIYVARVFGAASSFTAEGINGPQNMSAVAKHVIATTNATRAGEDSNTPNAAIRMAALARTSVRALKRAVIRVTGICRTAVSTEANVNSRHTPEGLKVPAASPPRGS